MIGAIGRSQFFSQTQIGLVVACRVAVHYRGEAPMFTDIVGQVIDGGVGSYIGAQSVLQGAAGAAIAVPRKRLTVLLASRIS